MSARATRMLDTWRWSMACRRSGGPCRQRASGAACRARLRDELDQFQKKLFDRALEFQKENTYELSTRDQVVAHFKERGGFVWVPGSGDAECEERAKAEAGGVTIRTIDAETMPSGKCFVCGKPATHRVSLAKAY